MKTGAASRARPFFMGFPNREEAPGTLLQRAARHDS